VSCDRADCWRDEELFKHRQAINVFSGDDQIGDQVRGSQKPTKLGEQRGPADRGCLYEAELTAYVSVYVEDCECCEDDPDCCLDTKGKAYNVLAHVTETLSVNSAHVAGRRILYKGSTYEQEALAEHSIAVVTGRFRIDYLFDQNRPWVVGS